ncbi:MAG: prepilin-type N-terminal cleavage/methylation domain-containing protein [Pseudomonadota bacterium]
MRSLAAKNKICEQGFTLIEVITVVVILSIVAVLGGKFVVDSTRSYQSTQTRSRLLNTGRQAIERMSRQLRVALPYSARITNVAAGAACIEFFPVVSGGTYITAVADTLNGVLVPRATVDVSPHTIDFGAAQYVSIGAMSSAELYESPVSRATLSSRTSSQLNLSAAKRWQQNSPRRRFYLLDSPQAFCLIANQLRFYDNQDATGTGVNINSTHSVIAENVTAVTPFALSAASESRNLNVLLNLTFTLNGEFVEFNQSVTIRNVP